MERPPLGRFYEVGGRRLLLHRSGAGSPAVVFLPGAGTIGLDHVDVQERVAAFTTSVVYDRAGTGWSDPADLPRTLAEVTGELRELLQAAAIPGPYVLVGHSLGGAYARDFAQCFPGEVAGLVLVETEHEDYDAYMPTELTEVRGAVDVEDLVPDVLPDEVVRFYRELFAKELASLPEEVRDVLVEHHVSPGGLREGVRQAANRDALHDELRAGRPLPDVPMIVLTATGIDAFKEAVLVGETEEHLRAEIDGKRRLYDALAASVSRGENRLVEGAGHASIVWRHPDAIARAVRDVLGR